MQSRSWVTIPLVTSVIVVGVALLAGAVFQLVHVETLRQQRDADYTVGDIVLGAVGYAIGAILVMALWTVIAAVIGYLARGRWARRSILPGFLAALVLCVPAAIVVATRLTASGMWQGLAIVPFAALVVAPVILLIPLRIAVGSSREARRG